MSGLPERWTEPLVATPGAVVSREARQELLHQARHWLRGLSRSSTETAVRALCAQVVRAFWNRRTDSRRRGFRPWPRNGDLPFGLRRLAKQVAGATDGLSLLESSYDLSSLYTSLLPDDLRARRGAYYTPPMLAERLLDLAAGEGVDWYSARMLDPACGGGAFLLPLAHRMLGDHRILQLDPIRRLEHLETHLAGIELDPFAAWLTRSFLTLMTLDLSDEAGRAFAVPILQADALAQVWEDERRFDLVIGNPPYGKLRLDADRRRLFARSLFGHANSYGMFLDAALRWRSPRGLVAFLTPTSFLGGQYFSRLRSLLLAEAPPLVIDVVEARSGIFDSVQQETCLAVFGPNPTRSTVVHLLATSGRGVETRRAGTFSLAGPPGAPWLLPRTREQARVAARASDLGTRLHDLGYKASTGPLVWNRHKDQLRRRSGEGSYPLIWAEAVRPNQFCFDYRERAEAPFLALKAGQQHLLCRQPCVLVQRTTAKEQRRRLVACAVPRDFIRDHEAFVVENHVNLLRPVQPSAVDPGALAAVLNTRSLDLVFRCLSGSVAVSATELHALPLPPRALFEAVQELLTRHADEDALETIEQMVAEAYGSEVR